MLDGYRIIKFSFHINIKTRSENGITQILVGENNQEICPYFAFKSPNIRTCSILLYNFEHMFLMITFNKTHVPFYRNQIVFEILNLID